MAQIFGMPQPGSTMEEGTILQWLKQEGETFQSGDVLLEIETDKASVEIEAETGGVLRKILATAGATVPIRQPIAIFGTADEPIDDLLAQVGAASNGTDAGHGAAPVAAAATPQPTAATAIAESVAATPTNGTVFLSPRAARLADQNGVPIAALAGRGTGPEGRVIERDVLAYVEAQKTAKMEEAAKPAPRATPLAARIADDLGVNIGDLAAGLPGSRVRSEDVLRHAQASTAAVPNSPLPFREWGAGGLGEGFTSQPFAGMRKRIADNVAKSAFTAPHVTLTLEVDMTACGEFRQQLIPEVEKAYGTRLSFTDILVKAVAKALGDHPLLNAALIGDELRVYDAKNIGVAVALDEGLIVPVVKNAESKSLGAVSSELKQLVERSRTGKFTPDDLAGGTFSITNLGAFGIDVFDPIIVPPQAAILGVGRIADKPIVVNREVVVRSMMNLCLSFDHRIVDGAPAARFLQRLKALLESPLTIII